MGSFPNIGRAREAAQRAEQIALLPGVVQNREADLVVRCPRGTVVCRVMPGTSGRVFIPYGRHRRKLRRSGEVVFNGWEDATPPYWLEPGHVETVRASCRCCAELWTFTTTQLLEQIGNGSEGRITVRLPLL